MRGRLTATATTARAPGRTLRHRTDLDRVRDTFATLADIPGVRGFEVGVDTRRDAASDDEPDLVVHAVLDDAGALEAYEAHPIHQRSVEVVRPLRELRIAVDEEVDGTAPPAPAPGQRSP